MAETLAKGTHVICKANNAVLVVEGTDLEVFGKSWEDNGGNPACLIYACRISKDDLPLNGTVYYTKNEHDMGCLVHESEIEIAVYDWICQKCGDNGESNHPIGSPCGQEYDDAEDCDGVIQCELRKVQNG